VLLMPLWLAGALLLRVCRDGPVLHSRQVVKLPARREAYSWRLFRLFSFGIGWRLRDRRNAVERVLFFARIDHLPALWAVAAGNLHFVGLPPRSKSELAALDPDWLAQVLGCKVGIATLADLHWAADISSCERYAADAYYSARHNLWLDLGILRRWLLRLPGQGS
jgi:lipopolysaccharide/colanic/teichoic acid biosynthesis glycosyltransferase